MIPTRSRLLMTRTFPTFRAAQAVAAAITLGLLAACGAPPPQVSAGDVARRDGSVYAVHDTAMQGTFDAAGVAMPVRQATLSTKLMGTVIEVLVREGESVASGQPLVRIDARDLAAKGSQVAASMAAAEALHADAQLQAGRIRALYADSAATRAQLDAAETGLARAEAGLRAARAASAEMAAVTTYSVIRAPFAGQVTRRFVDPGAFAAPGAPMVTVQDASRLRITASVTPQVARSLRRGQVLGATIEGMPVRATVEGVVPAGAGNLYTVNALVANPGGAVLAGSTAIIAVPGGSRTSLVVPVHAITREGDLTGVMLRTDHGDELRWVRLGVVAGDVVEVIAGLRAGDRVVSPASVTLAGSN